jgi:lysyl-tRNA synthetase class 2
METGMKLLSDFAATILGKPNTDKMSYELVFKTKVGLNPHLASTEEMRSVCESYNIDTASFESEFNNRDFWLNLLLTHVIEKKLGLENPVIVYDWPASQSALAIVRDGDPPVAERFEMYVNGVEIANGYHELLDANELASRNSVNNQLRVKDGNSLLPEDSRLLSAMRSGIPGCAGVALGVDRLVMLATEADSIDEVVAFPFEKA